MTPVTAAPRRSKQRLSHRRERYPCPQKTDRPCRRPRAPGPLPEATAAVSHHHPACGDVIDVLARFDVGLLQTRRFEARGCMVSQAAATMLCEALEGDPASVAVAAPQQTAPTHISLKTDPSTQADLFRAGYIQATQ